MKSASFFLANSCKGRLLPTAKGTHQKLAGVLAAWILIVLGSTNLAAQPEQDQDKNSGFKNPQELDEKRLESWILQLADPSFKKREMAENVLTAIGESALPRLRAEAANGKQLEVRYRVRKIIERIMSNALTSKAIESRFSLIEAGDFKMGSPKNEDDHQENEKLHRVEITKPFMMGVHEITQEQYEKVMEHNPSWYSKSGGGKRSIARFDVKKFPVDSISWFDAIEFCNRLSELDHRKPFYSLTEIKREEKSIVSAKVAILGGTGYRLPTEAEWEYACRAGTTSPYHFGHSKGGGNFQYRIQHYGGNTTNDLKRTTIVGNYKPNRWGLYDMHGNVAEWCWDWYDKSYYEKSAKEDPTGPKQGKHRSIRGGSFLVRQPKCRSAIRYWQAPGEGRYYVGFRVARNPSKEMLSSNENTEKKK